MTISGAIELFRTLMPNAYPDSVLLLWLTEIDCLAQRDSLRVRGEDPGEDRSYTAETDPETVLFIPEPWAVTCYPAELGLRAARNDNDSLKMALFQSALQEARQSWLDELTRQRSTESAFRF